jgi:hypothetical protein
MGMAASRVAAGLSIEPRPFAAVHESGYGPSRPTSGACNVGLRRKRKFEGPYQKQKQTRLATIDIRQAATGRRRAPPGRQSTATRPSTIRQYIWVPAHNRDCQLRPSACPPTIVNVLGPREKKSHI